MWMFSYFKEKQEGRPEKVESMCTPQCIISVQRILFSSDEDGGKRRKLIGYFFLVVFDIC